MYCAKCGKEANASDRNCSGCGAALNAGEAVPEAQATREDFYRAVIGPKNQDYYLRQFAKFDNQGKAGVSWHWPALFVTFYWLLYRKMWGTAVLYFLSPYIVFIPLGVVAVLLGKSGETFIGIVYLLYVVALFLAPPLFANALYYRQCKKRIAQAAASGKSTEWQLGELTGKGGTSKLFLIIVVFAFFAIIGILAAIAIPAYQDYTARAQTVGAVQIGKNASDSFATYYKEKQEIPSNLAQTGFTQALPDYVKAVGVDGQSGIITITMARPPLADKSIQLAPMLEASGDITWVCSSKDIADKNLPTQCRQNNK